MNKRQWCLTASGLMLLATVPAMPAWAQSLDVPQPWIAYAQLTGRQFQAWLEADDDAANQLHQFLAQRILNAKDDAPPAAIVIRAWIGPDGWVTRVGFHSLGDPKADAILHSLLTSHPITEPPPPDMRQPLRVRLRLQANPNAAPGTAASAP